MKGAFNVQTFQVNCPIYYGISVHIHFRLFIVYILLRDREHEPFIVKIDTPNRTIEKANMNLHFEQWNSVRSIKYQFITTDTQQYQ